MNKKMTSDTTWTDRILGLIGLFLIGVIGAVADRYGSRRAPRQAVQRHVPGP